MQPVSLILYRRQLLFKSGINAFALMISGIVNYYLSEEYDSDQ